MRESMSPSRGSGTKRGLTFESRSADKGGMGSSWRPGTASANTPRPHERGQALVEFALIVPLFLFIVVGVIQFGIGLNYWLDLNRLANQGARFAVVDHGWTNCPKADAGTSSCDDLPADHPTSPTLQDYLKQSRTSEGSGNLQASITFDDATTPEVGQSVTVRIATCYRLLAILDLAAIPLRGRATMRIEQAPTNYGPGDNDAWVDDPCNDPSL